MVQFANLDYRRHQRSGCSAHRVAQRLEEDVKAGARGLKIFKDFGLSLKRSNGQRVPVDDPAFDEVFETCARLDLPVLIHTGEPAPFFDPVDERNERWLELQVHPERRRPPSDFPTFETLMAERDRLFAKHPKTMFIAAHFGFHANDLDRLGQMLDRLPNVYTETGAIIEELARQPRAARAFFVKYQDRDPLREGHLRGLRVPGLLPHVRDRRRVLRRLPRLPRLLEAVRPGPAGRRPAQALLRQRAQAGPRPAGRGLSTDSRGGHRGRTLRAWRSTSSPAEPDSSDRTWPQALVGAR